MENNKTGVLVALVVGAAIGSVLGILYAPSKGRKTRKKIKSTVKDTKENLCNWIDDAKDSVSKIV